MGRSWRSRWPLLAGLALLVLAGWLVLTEPGGEQGAGPARPSSSAAAPSAGSSAGSSAGATPDSGLPVLPLAELPVQARETLDLIRSDGPFPYDRDGITFGNRERLLPARERGYYREYTVPTPGEDDRGARRLVTGDAGDTYWTDDHYESFAQVEVPR